MDRGVRLKEIRERESKATGDWGFNESEGCIEGLDIFSIENRRFVAHARADIPWLLDLVDSLQRELEDRDVSLYEQGERA